MSGTNTTQANTGNSDPVSSSGTPDTFVGLLQSLTVDGETGLLDFLETSGLTLEGNTCAIGRKLTHRLFWCAHPVSSSCCLLL